MPWNVTFFGRGRKASNASKAVDLMAQCTAMREMLPQMRLPTTETQLIENQLNLLEAFANMPASKQSQTGLTAYQLIAKIKKTLDTLQQQSEQPQFPEASYIYRRFFNHGMVGVLKVDNDQDENYLDDTLYLFPAIQPEVALMRDGDNNLVVLKEETEDLHQETDIDINTIQQDIESMTERHRSFVPRHYQPAESSELLISSHLYLVSKIEGIEYNDDERYVNVIRNQNYRGFFLTPGVGEDEIKWVSRSLNEFNPDGILSDHLKLKVREVTSKFFKAAMLEQINLIEEHYMPLLNKIIPNNEINAQLALLKSVIEDSQSVPSNRAQWPGYIEQIFDMANNLILPKQASDSLASMSR